MIGGKVYVGTTAEEAESCTYEYSSERAQALNGTSHEYYLYAKADEGFLFAGFGTTASATTSFNSTANPYKVTIATTSNDEAKPTEKTYYASFKYAADNKPTVCYGNFTLVAMVAELDPATDKYVNVESDEAGMLGLNYNPDASGKGAVTTEPIWHSGSTYACEAISKPYTSGSVYFPFTIFAKPNFGYEFVGWSSTSTTTNPSQKGTKVEDYSYYYSDSYTRTSVSNTNYPGSCGVEGAPKTKKYYAVFKKLNPEDLVEPTGETTVEVTEFKSNSEPVTVSGTTATYKEASATKNFYVDLVLSENIPYEHPGSDKNAKPSEAAKRFVTVTGVNGNKSDVASYSYSYESNDLGLGGTSSSDTSYGTEYWCKTIRLFFPFDIKADNYTVHIPYGLYTTVNGNKTPAYEFTINVTADENPYLTIAEKPFIIDDKTNETEIRACIFPEAGFTYKYKKATNTSTPNPIKGELEASNITATIEFNEVVNSIDNTKLGGVKLTNTTEGINYRYKDVYLPAKMYGRVDGQVAISYPELVNGEYILTIPEGLFVGASDKVNEEQNIHFSLSGFNSQLQPYTMVTDQITPKSGDMTQSVEKLSDITISYKGEFGEAKALVSTAQGINIRRYTEVIEGEGESAKPVRTYYDVTTTPSAKVENGKLIVSFSPALRTGMYEVNVPAGMAANMEPSTMTMAEKVNTGYAETPAYSLTFNVESPDLWVGEHEVKYAEYDYMTRTQGTPEATTYTIVKEDGNYYLTDLLDTSDEPNKVLLDVIDATTLTIHEGGFSNDEATYNIAPMSMVGGANDPINFVLGDDDKVTVPNKGLIYIEDEEYNMYMFVFGSDLTEDEPELNAVALASSTPADNSNVSNVKKITLKYEQPFAGFNPDKDYMAACSLKDSEGNEITITAVNHYNVDDAANEIDFKFAAPLAMGTYTFTFNEGIMQGGNIMTGIYTNEAAEITFTVVDEYEANLKITSAKWGTFVAPFDVTIPEQVTAYTVEEITDNTLTLKEVSTVTILANTPVIVYSDEEVDEIYQGSIKSYDKIGTTLVGVFENTDMEDGNYILQNHDGDVAFYRVETSETVKPWIAPSRCYIVAPTGSQAKAFGFAGEVLGINAIFGNGDATIYDINGRKLSAPTKGVNIINNKKVVIK